MAQQTNNELAKVQHPEYQANVSRWVKYWMSYDGGEPFIASYLQRYSKRETKNDFDTRAAVSFNPGDAKACINDVRDSLLSRLHEVNRTGDKRYTKAMEENVDTFRSSMLTFIGSDILPRLLTQSKVYVTVDALPKPEGAVTRAEDTAVPYLWSFTAEQCLSWTYDELGKIVTILIKQQQDVVDEKTGLVNATRTVYRYMKLMQAGESITVAGYSFDGPGVAVLVLDNDGKLVEQGVLNLTRVPVVEFKICQSLMVDIADMQVALLNLSSSDMAFLFRGNFPLYTEQYDPATRAIAPRARKKHEGTPPSQNFDRDETDSAEEKGSSRGLMAGKLYQKGLNAPSFIAPQTDNLSASMKKQDDISKRIRIMTDLALTSLSVAAIEQSGKSKEADRVGLSAGLRYIATQLESGEREVNDVFHEMLGIKVEDATVKYPDEYSTPSDEQRQAELDRLIKARASVNSPTYQKTLSKKIADSQLRGYATEEEITLAKVEIQEMPYIDESKERAEVVGQDLLGRLISRGTAAKIRGYTEDEPQKNYAEKIVEADGMMGASTAADGQTAEGEEVMEAPAGEMLDKASAASAQAGASTVAELAMNGSQVASLQAIVQNVSAGVLAPEAAVLMILAAFPSLPEDTVRKMINSAATFKPTVEVPAAVKGAAKTK